MRQRVQKGTNEISTSTIIYGSIAIIILCIVVGIGAFAWNRHVSNVQSVGGQVAAPVVPSLRPDDHVLGIRTAPVILFVYTDTECPFCKNLHEYTIPKLRGVYGAKIAVVYRHNPLDAIHPRARYEQEAAECAYKQGGDTAFWKFISEIFSETASNETFPPSELSVIAANIGLDTSKFNSCLSSGEMKARVARDSQDAAIAGLDITPSTVVYGYGKSIVVSGNYYSQLHAAIETVLDSVSH